MLHLPLDQVQGLGPLAPLGPRRRDVSPDVARFRPLTPLTASTGEFTASIGGFDDSCCSTGGTNGASRSSSASLPTDGGTKGFSSVGESGGLGISGRSHMTGFVEMGAAAGIALAETGVSSGSSINGAPRPRDGSGGGPEPSCDREIR